MTHVCCARLTKLAAWKHIEMHTEAAAAPDKNVGWKPSSGSTTHTWTHRYIHTLSPRVA